MLAAVILLILLTATVQLHVSQYTVTLTNASKLQPSLAQDSSSQNTDTGQGNVVSILKGNVCYINCTLNSPKCVMWPKKRGACNTVNIINR